MWRRARRSECRPEAPLLWADLQQDDIPTDAVLFVVRARRERLAISYNFFSAKPASSRSSHSIALEDEPMAVDGVSNLQQFVNLAASVSENSNIRASAQGGRAEASKAI